VITTGQYVAERVVGEAVERTVAIAGIGACGIGCEHGAA